MTFGSTKVLFGFVKYFLVSCTLWNTNKFVPYKRISTIQTVQKVCGYSVPFLMYLFVFQKFPVSNCSVIMADYWIRTNDLGCQKRPLCPLRHSHKNRNYLKICGINKIIEWEKCVFFGDCFSYFVQNRKDFFENVRMLLFLIFSFRNYFLLIDYLERATRKLKLNLSLCA